MVESKRNETGKVIGLEIDNVCEIEKTNDNELFREMISFSYEGKRADVVATIMNDETIKAYNMDGDFYYTEAENPAEKEKIPENVLEEMLSVAKYNVVSDYENIEKYKQEQEIYFTIYTKLYDDNYNHCECSFISNGYNAVSPEKLHQENIEFLKDIMECNVTGDEIVNICPELKDYIMEINEASKVEYDYNEIEYDYDEIENVEITDNENVKKFKDIKNNGELLASQSQDSYYATFDLPNNKSLYKHEDTYFITTEDFVYDRENGEPICYYSFEEVDFERAKEFVREALVENEVVEHCNEQGNIIADENYTVTSAGKAEFGFEEEAEKKVKKNIERE